MKKNIFAAFLFLLIGNSYAGILVEPFANVAVSGDAGSTSPKDDLSGTAYGLRLGYKTMGFSVAAEYSTGAWTTEDEATKAEVDYTPTKLGLFVGYDLPILFRVYAAYIFSSKLEVDSSKDEYSGSGTKIGVGYTGLPFVSIDIEYAMYSYDEYETAAGVTTPLSPEFEANAISIGVSVPLDL